MNVADTKGAGPPAERPDAPSPTGPTNGVAGFVVKAARGVGVLALFGPHLAVIRLVGPRWGLRWAHLVAHAHYVLTYLGAQRATLRTLRRVRPWLECPESPREILRKHLVVKHHSFAEWRLASTRRGQAYLKEKYNLVPQDVEDALRVLHDAKKGMLFVVYHYGMYKTIASALALVYDVKISTAAYLSAHYSASTLGPFARIAFRNAIRTANAAPAKSIFLKPGAKPTSLFRALRRGEIVGIAADGMIADEFCQVPFLGGQMGFPTGWARLAGLTGVHCCYAFASLDGVHARKMSFTLPAPIAGDEQSVLDAVRAGAAELEARVRVEPWNWHVWRRLTFDQTSDGAPVIHAAPVTTRSEEVFTGDK